jgi:uncharacterized membrane protein
MIFPFALVFIGLVLMFLGMQYQTHQELIRHELVRIFQPLFEFILPNDFFVVCPPPKKSQHYPFLHCTFFGGEI